MFNIISSVLALTAHRVVGKIIGNRYVDAHFEYVIVEQARWEEL